MQLDESTSSTALEKVKLDGIVWDISCTMRTRERGGRRKESEKEKERKEEKERDLLIRSLKENFSESIDQNPPLTSIEFFF